MEWELSKENIQPLRSGRDMKALQSALDHSSSSEHFIMEEKLKFEEELRSYSGPDPLEVWIRYIRWTEQYFPSGKDDQLMALVQKCLKRLKGDPRYTNDTRYLYVWLKLAQRSSNFGSLGIYEFMDGNGECTELAQFYIQWAYELERAEDFQKAAQIYRKGMRIKAEPMDKLEQEYERFEERMARRMAIHGEEAVDSPPEETRNFLGVLKGIGKKSQAPFIRQSTVSDVRCGQSEQRNENRSGGFTIFDEEGLLAGGPQKKKSSIPRHSSATSIPMAGKPEKENFRAPTTWNNPKKGCVPVKRFSSATALSSVKADFHVFQDTQAQEGSQHRRQTIAGEALQSKKATFNHPLMGFIGPEEDKKEVRMYKVNDVYMGGSEFSLEELRGLGYQKCGLLNSERYRELKGKIMALNVPVVTETSQLQQDELMDCSSPARVRTDMKAVSCGSTGSNEITSNNSAGVGKFGSGSSAFEAYKENSENIQSEKSISQLHQSGQTQPFQVFQETPRHLLQENSKVLPQVQQNQQQKFQIHSDTSGGYGSSAADLPIPEHHQREKAGNSNGHSNKIPSDPVHQEIPFRIYSDTSGYGRCDGPPPIPEHQQKEKAGFSNEALPFRIYSDTSGYGGGSAAVGAAERKENFAGNLNEMSRNKTPCPPVLDHSNPPLNLRTPLAPRLAAEPPPKPEYANSVDPAMPKENYDGISSSQSSGKSSGQSSPRGPMLPGNTSFTQKLYKDAIAVFSDTLPIANWLPPPSDQNEGTTSFGRGSSSGVAASDDFEAQFRDCGQPKKSEPSFQIFDENAPKATERQDVAKMMPKVPEEDKENVQPMGYWQSKMKRQLSGVLSPSKDIVTEPVEDIPREPRTGLLERPQEHEEATGEQRRVDDVFVRPLHPVRPALQKKRSESLEPPQADFSEVFDPNEPTLAKFGEVQAKHGVSSTPCHGMGPPPPCFSAIKPWEEEQGAAGPTETRDPFEVAAGEDFRPLAENVLKERELFIPRPPLPSQERKEVIEKNDLVTPEGEVVSHHQHMDAVSTTERRLSIIQETSREFRSGSTSCSSSGSQASDFSARRKAMSSIATPTPLQPIAEYKTFGGVATATTPGSVSGVPPPPLFDTREMLLPVTPFDEGKGSQIVGSEAKTPFTPADQKNWREFEREEEIDGLAHAVRRLSMGQGVVSVQIPEVQDCDENCEKTGFGLRTEITSGINPWDPNLIAQLLMRLPRRLDSYTNLHNFGEMMPAVKLGRTVELGGEQHRIEKLLGEGAFARAYKSQSVEDGREWVLKVQKPSCPWEFYICEELRRRFCHKELDKTLLPGVMQIKDAFLYNDGSFLVNEFHPHGTLLDLMNRMAEGGRSSVGEFVCVYLTIEMMKILEASHNIGIIHADIKPDNFLIKRIPQVDDSADSLLGGRVCGLKLIDWGRAIDMTLLPQGTTFSGTAQTSGFQCVEMMEGRPWTFQTDYFGLLGTCHVLLFGTYMKVYKSKTGEWRSTANFKRKWNVDLWKKLFHDFLNIERCENLPDLRGFREEMQDYFRMCLDEEWDNWEDNVNIVNRIFS